MRRSRLVATAVALLLCAACSPDRREPPGAAGRTVTVGVTGIGSLRPAEATTPAALTVLRAACDTLVGRDPSTGGLRPALASAWTLEPGARSLTVALAPKTRYHDGTRVLPTAVAEQLSSVAQSGGAAPAVRELAALLGQPGQEGAGSVRATGDGKVRIDLPRPFAGLPALLANPALAPVSPGAADESDGPACAGPYRIERGDGGVRLVRDGASGGRGAASSFGFEEIVVKELETADEAYAALEAGAVDAAPVPESRVAEAESRAAGHARRGTSQVTYLAFDTASAPTSSPAFRRAVSLALDRTALVDAGFGDRRPPATRWLVEASGRPVPRSCEEGAGRVADAARARALLASAGIDPRSVRLPILFDPARTSPLVVQAVEATLEGNLGIGVRPEALEVAGVGAAVAGRHGPKAWIATTPGDIGVPEHVLEALFRTGSADNTNHVADARMDALLDRARRAAGTGEREQAYAAAEERACELMPDVPLWTGVSHWAFDPRKLAFTGSSPIDANGALLLRQARPR